jgi:hypothetical protein
LLSGLAEVSIVTVGLPEDPVAAPARYESRGLLRVADAVLSAAALVFEGKVRKKDKDTKNMLKATKYFLMFTLCISKPCLKLNQY